MRLGAGIRLLAAVGGLLLAGACSRETPRQKAQRFVAQATQSNQKKDYARAIVELKNAIKWEPDNAEAKYQLGVAYSGMRDYISAVRYFWEAADADKTRADARLRVAEILESANDRSLAPEAEQHVREVLKLKPGDLDALRLLAVAQWQQGKPDEAVKTVTAILQQDPKHQRALLTLAMIQFESRKPAEAEKTLLEARNVAVGGQEASVALGQLYLMTNRRAQAQAEFQRALDRDPTNAVAMIELANLQSAAGDKEGAAKTYEKLSGLPDDAYRTAHAAFLLETGQKGAALTELEKLYQQFPKSREVRSRLVDAYFAADRQPDAERVLNDALKANFRDVDAREQRSRIYLQQSKPGLAKEDLEEVLRYRPNSVQAHYLMAHAYAGLGDRKSYQSELEEALRLNPKLLAARVELSRVLRRANGPVTALALMDQSPVEQKDLFPVILEKAWCLLLLEKLRESQQLADAALKTSRTPEALLLAGLIQVKNGKLAAARPLLEEALKGDGENVEILQTLVLSYAAEGRRDLATARLAKHAAANPRSAAVQFFYGGWLEDQGDLAGARSAYEATRQNDPAHRRAAIGVARIDMMQGKWPEAKQTIDRLLAAAPKDQDARLALAMWQEGNNQRDAAMATYRQILSVESKHLVALNNLAALLTENNDTLTEAIDLAQQAKQISPDHPAVNDTLGWAFFKKELYKSAVPALEHAVAAGGTGRVKYHLAMAYYKAGNKAAARKMIAEVDRNLPELKAGLPDFSN